MPRSLDTTSIQETPYTQTIQEESPDSSTPSHCHDNTQNSPKQERIAVRKDLVQGQLVMLPSPVKTPKVSPSQSVSSSKLETSGSATRHRKRSSLSSSNMASPAPQRSGRACRNLSRSFSESSSLTICRICHEGDKVEQLISPCKCSGTMGLLHRSCIEQWLGSSNSNRCEICDFEYQVEKQCRPFWQWLREPKRPNDKRNMWGDIICFLVLTPLAAVSAWLCVTGALHYAEWTNQWEAAGLITLTVLLVLIYIVWCLVALRYHYKVWADWREQNPLIRIVDLGDDNNNISLDDRDVETAVINGCMGLCSVGARRISSVSIQDCDLSTNLGEVESSVGLISPRQNRSDSVILLANECKSGKIDKIIGRETSL
ncbi:E3 ubiquitin-protein ligase MARCH2-like isoform X2 [Lingula anatina]|nr:E3 ubiquitin-protein ligase MARCH2-like isoform X2 [Lingula anatina]|eukprot:XP_023930379.1 E3 ubiquitin-protein ligase MARCH2-like isoform X2 [Lingula anatina]